MFTGGGLLAATPPAVHPAGLNDDDDRALESIERLLPLDFDVIADARTGLLSTARPQLHWLVGADVVPPERSLLGDRLDEPILTQGRGTYVEEWSAGPDGHRPGLVVAPDGVATVIADPARPEHRPFLGRQVVATGVRIDDPHIASDELADVALELEEGESESDGQLPLAATREELDQLAHQWVVVEGVVVALQPWTVRASHGEGLIQLEDGTVKITGPRSIPTGRPVVLLGRVRPGDQGPVLGVVSLCSTVERCREIPSRTPTW